MKLKKLFAMLMALAMVAGLLAACSNDTGNASTPPASEPVSDSQAPESDAPESEAPALDPVTLNVAYMPNYGSLWAVIAAQELGYFEDEAITVNLMSFDSGPVIISAMESGSVDFGYIGDGAHKLCVQGQASIIGLSHISNGDAVIGGPNVTTLEDLKGKTVAYSSGTSSETILTNALNSVGLTIGRHHPHGYGRCQRGNRHAVRRRGCLRYLVPPEPDYPGRDGRRHQAGPEYRLLRHQHLPG